MNAFLSVLMSIPPEIPLSTRRALAGQSGTWALRGHLSIRSALEGHSGT